MRSAVFWEVVQCW